MKLGRPKGGHNKTHVADKTYTLSITLPLSYIARLDLARKEAEMPLSRGKYVMSLMDSQKVKNQAIGKQ